MLDADGQRAIAVLEELRGLAPEIQLGRIRRAGGEREVIRAMADAALALTTTDAARALQAGEAVLPIADRIGDPLARARVRHALARALCFAGRFEEALVAAEDAGAIATRGGHPLEAGRARLASMHALGELGRLDQAIAVGTDARALFESIDEPGFAARADNNLGIIHQRRDEPTSALACFGRARPRLPRDPLVLGHLDNNRGEALVLTNDFAGAERAYESARAAFDEAGADMMTALAEGNLADLAARSGQLQRTLEHFERARARLDPVEAPAMVARLRAEQAEAKTLLGLPEDARAEYEEVLPDLDRHGLRIEAARARCGAGLALLQLDRLAEAETALAASAVAFDELGRALSRAKVDLVRAELALRHGRAGDARRLASLAMAQLHDRPADSAAARHLLARAAIASGERPLAEAELGAALAAARQLDLAPLVAEILLTRGRLYRADGRLDEAVADLRAAVRQIERVRGSLQAERFRTAFLGHRTPTHEALVLALLDRDDSSSAADAFAVAEHSKSRSLLEEILNAPGPGGTPIGGSGLERELDRGRAELNALYSRLADDQATGAEALRSWSDAMRQRERRLDRIEARLATTRTTAAIFAAPADLSRVQARLAPGELLLEYFVADGRFLAFAVSHDDVAVHRAVAPVEAVARRIERLQFQINRALRPGALDGPRGDRLTSDARAELSALHAMLLGPAQETLAGASRLTIVPHGCLHLVPFHALWDGGRHLVETHAVSQVPSASLFVNLAAGPRDPAPGRPLVVGIADDVAPLIEPEVDHVARQLGCRADEVLRGPAATVEALVAGASRASALHLACHGRFLPENPAASGLRLADRWLTVREISSLAIRADLVTLSGCETGLSRVRAGDELAGLLRAFFAAGAASMIVSLWRVDDRSGRRFMERLYGSRRETRSHSDHRDRLRTAQLAMIEDHPHPAHWAPFMLVGRP